MANAKKLIIAASILCSLAIVGGALLAARARQDPAPEPGGGTAQRNVSRSELAAATGKDGKRCFVAVDATVYEIKDFSLWRNGQHKPSNGEAYCGADMTAEIDKSPHGRKMLDVLIKVGPLVS